MIAQLCVLQFGACKKLSSIEFILLLERVRERGGERERGERERERERGAGGERERERQCAVSSTT